MAAEAIEPSTFFIIDQGDLDVFRSMQDAARYLEPWIVHEEGVLFVDARGDEFMPLIEGSRVVGFTKRAGGSNRHNILEIAMRDFLVACRVNPTYVAELNYPSLVRECERFLTT